MVENEGGPNLYLWSHLASGSPLAPSHQLRYRHLLPRLTFIQIHCSQIHKYIAHKYTNILLRNKEMQCRAKVQCKGGGVRKKGGAGEGWHL